MLEHKDIKGTIEFDKESKMIFGKLVGVNGLVMYEAENAEEFEKNFISAVEDYITLCEENEMPIKKEYKGVFNVRTSPKVHEELITICLKRDVKLNTVVNEAFDMYIGQTELSFELNNLKLLHGSAALRSHIKSDVKPIGQVLAGSYYSPRTQHLGEKIIKSVRIARKTK